MTQKTLATSPALGTLTNVDARVVWRDEARNFTPWLAHNLQLLGQALGLNLELEATEVNVGEFSVDIVARDLFSNNLVVIENQLERTDHGHLGQLLTYAAGKGATRVVWISPTFREEHRQALDWLNEHTGEGLDFFGVEIELLQIGASLPAPHFKLVSEPNEWAKATKASGGSAPSELGIRYQLFFRGIVERFKALRPGLISGSRVGTQNWYPFSAGRSGFGFVWSMATKSRFRVELYIDVGDGDVNTRYFEELRSMAGEIEPLAGEPIEWEPIEGKRACRVCVYRQVNKETFDSDPAVVDWAVTTMSKWVDAFKPRIASL
jgi:hypothetical protein